MAGSSHASAKRASWSKRSSWSRIDPNSRLIAGAALIILIGLSGLSPKILFGVNLVWPHAALWGAVGWGLAGYSLRPMLLLFLFGLAQDISFNSPLGSFVLVNFVTYGAASWLSNTPDMQNNPVKAFIVAAASMAVGMSVLWVLATSNVEYGVRILPLVSAYLVTLILFVPVAPIFRLGGRPGERGFVR